MKRILLIFTIFATVDTLAQELSFDSYSANGAPFNAQVQVTTSGEYGQRSFTLTSNESSGGKTFRSREFTENSEYPLLNSGSDWFDALYAMAIDDLVLNSVSTISNENYQNGLKIACECFETGQYWSYVWTRDVSYAGDLALAQFDTERLKNSLLFKTSSFREGLAPNDAALAHQIIQDTGSGGSWPVSTDRVTWAWAAEEALKRMPNNLEFKRQAFNVLRGTIEADRIAAYRVDLGVYGGEQSFLDWRTQTYPFWITSNLSDMAYMPSLSTNIGHFQALTLTATLANDLSYPALAKKYQKWATQLKTAINDQFWLQDTGQYSSLIVSAENSIVMEKYDMLGTALAIISGVADKEKAEKALNHYPHVPMGVPVIFPMQPTKKTYHNRGIWPFVSAYALKAAATTQHVPAANSAIHSLTRAASLHLSNMENMEWLTGKDYFDDGPAVNSPRQLWSVAGYLHLVMETTFGLTFDNERTLSINPFLTNELRSALGDTVATLNNIPVKDKHINIELVLPKRAPGTGFYPVDALFINGERQPTKTVQLTDIPDSAVLKLTFKGLRSNNHHQLNLLNTNGRDFEDKLDKDFFAPVEPTITSFKQLEDGRVKIGLFDRLNKEVTYRITQNGRIIDQNIEEKTWTTPTAISANTRQCFSVQAFQPTRC